MVKGNYHTHTYRCKHAAGDIEDYAIAAVKSGLKILGISDHSPLPGDKWLEMRMSMAELPEYVATIDKAQLKYPQLKILKGMECEYLEKSHFFYEEELLGRLEFDFLAASAHYYPYRGDWKSGWTEIKNPRELRAYAEYVVQMIETGLFDYVAHPDMFAASYHFWDSDAAACSKYIFEAAKEHGVALEINANGFRKGIRRMRDGIRYMYPIEPFWELASEYDILVTANSDAHLPEEIISRVKDSFEIAAKYKLKTIDYPDFCNRRNKIQSA